MEERKMGMQEPLYDEFTRKWQEKMDKMERARTRNPAEYVRMKKEETVIYWAVGGFILFAFLVAIF